MQVKVSGGSPGGRSEKTVICDDCGGAGGRSTGSTTGRTATRFDGR